MARSNTSTHRLFSSTGIPLYVQLAEHLRRRVRSGAWAPGTMLPSIPALMCEFDVARVTVRQAIGLLSSEGLLSPERGRGTFVTEQAGMQRGLTLSTTLDDLLQIYRGDRPELATLSFDDDASPAISALEGKPADRYVHIRRVHSRRGERYCVISIFIAAEIFARAPQRFREELALEVLTSLPDLELASGQQVLTISGADAETAALLGLPVKTPMADVRRLLRDRTGSIIYLADVTYRGDTIQLRMDLKT
jgi:GntR family transcriptional regulator